MPTSNPDSWDFPDSAVVETLGFHCREHRFDPWSGNMGSYMLPGEKKNS